MNERELLLEGLDLINDLDPDSRLLHAWAQKVKRHLEGRHRKPGPVRCSSMIVDGAVVNRCSLTEGHGGEHEAMLPSGPAPGYAVWLE